MVWRAAWLPLNSALDAMEVLLEKLKSRLFWLVFLGGPASFNLLNAIREGVLWRSLCSAAMLLLGVAWFLGTPAFGFSNSESQSAASGPLSYGLVGPKWLYRTLLIAAGALSILGLVLGVAHGI